MHDTQSPIRLRATTAISVLHHSSHIFSFRFAPQNNPMNAISRQILKIKTRGLGSDTIQVTRYYGMLIQCDGLVQVPLDIAVRRVFLCLSRDCYGSPH
ncbi:hypothetical protein E1B28_003936 [Marasmius oreades]|uniref:Uncharacterized protein n=1 Tax=Marasmius oreades TaxID=181124 RepID=A0A9P8ABW2_9AGAR|nr:uncharacterized protein E1B28_003936 [Marasmius oreades]KAG7096507.1 hypothetical protein E1B28_003936 [Marasmius oreades]